MAEEDGRRARSCKVCSIEHSEEDSAVHNASRSHIFNFLLQAWCKHRRGLVKNRNGVEIDVFLQDLENYETINRVLTSKVNEGKHYYHTTPADLYVRGNFLRFVCIITNTRRDPIYLTNAILLHPYGWYSFEDPRDNISAGRPIQLNPGARYEVYIKFNPDGNVLVGSYNVPVCFTLQTDKKFAAEDADKVATFHIARSINITVEEGLVEQFENESPFTGTAWPRKMEKYDPTERIPYECRYVIPFEYRKIFLYGIQQFPSMRGNDSQKLARLKKQMEPGYVTQTNYKDFWHNVLWLEEIAQELGLQHYNMENVPLNWMESGRLELVVPGLAEKRPSVVVNDMVDIRLHEDHTCYRGIIKKVNDTTVEIDKVDKELIDIIASTNQMNDEFDVKFVLSRLIFERCHHGVVMVVENGLLPCLFPPENPIFRVRQNLRTVTDSEFYNKTIITNLEQKEAVRNILNNTSHPYPYVVFGPPGTGKTVTIVEAILQIKNQTTNHVLVCAPSNAACDVITEKLLPHCDTTELIRIISANVDISTVHEVVLPYTNYNPEEECTVYVDSAKLRNYRIIVTTLNLVGKYSGYYHPDVVFIDEAAQAFEAQACIAIGLIEKGKQIVLAGDHKQLGPSSSSDAAKEYGLEISLLERLMGLDIYAQLNPNCTTMLIQNFRNHEMILRLPNDLFYGGVLQASSLTAALDPLAKIFVFQKIQKLYKTLKTEQKELEGKSIEFCNLISKECREGKSPSYYNQKELQMTLKYIQALLSLEMEDEDYKVKTTDIGVVTPYVRQVHKLKYLLQEHGIEGVEVGTTETFQGREKRIIIITTVRAKKDLLLYDKMYKLGFVRNPKRFNVAITRAMSKLIIIGCAHVLGTDNKWAKMMELCESVKGFCGAPYAKRTDDVMRTITSRLNQVDVRNN